MFQEASGPVQQILDALATVLSFVFGSFFRFLIILGIGFLVLGAVWADGVEAGHLAIYGGTSVLIGIMGRLFVWWKIQDEY